MDYLKLYREMISLRGLTDHTVKSYSTYIRSYLDYLQAFLHKQPEGAPGFSPLAAEGTFSFRPHDQRLYLAAPFLYNVCPPQTLGSHSAPYAEV